MDSSGIEPESPACHAGIFPLDDEPVSGPAGDSNPDPGLWLGQCLPELDELPGSGGADVGPRPSPGAIVVSTASGWGACRCRACRRAASGGDHAPPSAGRPRSPGRCRRSGRGDRLHRAGHVGLSFRSSSLRGYVSQWSMRELNPRLLHVRQTSCHWTNRPRILHATPVGPAGVEPASSRVSDGCLTARSTARIRVPGGLRPRIVQPGQLVPFCDRPQVRSSRDQRESNPLREFWRLAALPGAHPCQQSSLRLARATLSPTGSRRAVTPVSRILFYAIISLGTYQTINAPLTGSGLFGLHPPRSWRYSAFRPFLCLVKQ